MAFKMDAGRGNYAKTGKGIPMSFRQENFPPVGEKQEWEEDVIDPKTGEVNRLTNVERASVLVPAAVGRGDRNALSTQAAERKVDMALSYAKSKGEPLANIKLTATPEEFARGGQAVIADGGEYLTKERKKQAAKIKKAADTIKRLRGN